MCRLFVLCLIVSGMYSLNTFADQPKDSNWKAGVAKVKITPPKLMWMSGYASRTKPAEGTLTDLWAKALVLQDSKGNKAVLVTLDLVGIGRDLSLSIRNQLKQKHGLDRSQVILACSHTHTGPVVGSNLNVMYLLDADQQKLITEYAQFLQETIIAVVDDALSKLEPCTLSWGMGKTTFAVNRRNNPEKEVPKLKEAGKLKGPVDHEVPVLAVRNQGGDLRAIIFGYACHATVLSSFEWSGDYPGFAQIELEKQHPGVVALFWAGCGGDQNPLPRRTVALAKKYGNELAQAVEDVLKGQMKMMDRGLATRYREILLPLSGLPDRELLIKQIRSENKYLAARARLLLDELRKKGDIRRSYPYPVQVWRLGDVIWVALGGEVVVDYAIRLKREISPGSTWVTGYANDVMAYIPSLRIWQEGGYEGRDAMLYYGLPGVWDPRIEEFIVAEVRQLEREINQSRTKVK